QLLYGNQRTWHIRGREGWLAPAPPNGAHSSSGGKPPFPTSNVLRCKLDPIRLDPWARRTIRKRQRTRLASQPKSPLLTRHTNIVDSSLHQAGSSSICSLYQYTHALAGKCVEAYACRNPRPVYVSRRAQPLKDSRGRRPDDSHP